MKFKTCQSEQLQQVKQYTDTPVRNFTKIISLTPLMNEVFILEGGYIKLQLTLCKLKAILKE